MVRICTLSGTQTVTGAKTFSSTVALGGSATATTPSSGDDSTSVATTAYVQGEGFLTGNETITISGDISGSGTTSITGTLATVNSSPGTTSGVTVNGKGLVTAIAALQASVTFRLLPTPRSVTLILAFRQIALINLPTQLLRLILIARKLPTWLIRPLHRMQ